MSKENKKLIIVGSGIKSISHLTIEAQGYIKGANKVLYLLNEPVFEKWLTKEAKNIESLSNIYFKYNDRLISYQKISDKIVLELEKYKTVVVLIYGHPCFYAMPGLLAGSSLSDKANIQFDIIPGISSLDCLYADLEIDPGSGGACVFDATEFLLKEKVFDPTSHLILLQIAMIGNSGLPTNSINISILQDLLDYLMIYYGEEHLAICYEASLYPGMKPKIKKFPISILSEQDFTTVSTLYIPPLG